MEEKRKQKRTKTVYGLLGGLTAYIIIGSVGLYLLRTVWADYAIASKDKSYTVEMKLSRLTIGILASVAAGIAATIMANDRGKAAWFAGVIVLCFAAYNHFFRVWPDYPVWYHLSYLLPIIPVTGLSHRFVRKRKEVESSRTEFPSGLQNTANNNLNSKVIEWPISY